MKVRRDPRLELKGTDLLIKNLELEDRGEYDCEVESDREVPVSIRHSLDILHPPSVFPEPSSGGRNKWSGGSRNGKKLVFFNHYMIKPSSPVKQHFSTPGRNAHSEISTFWMSNTILANWMRIVSAC